jgi:hypothetical protein
MSDSRHPAVAAARHLARRSARRPGRCGLAAVLVAAATLAAACSSGIAGGSGGPRAQPVASLSGRPGHAANSGGPITTAQGDRDMVSFARCMRAHGVQMSDPYHRPGHAGLSLNMPSPGPASSGGYAACGHFLRPLIQAKHAGMAAAAAPRLPALTRYAGCMRGHDIPMLDPTPYGELNLGHVPGITSDFGRYSAQFRSADRACRHLLPAGVRDDGTGP